MDISKLSRHTQEAKERIANVLGLDKNDLKDFKKRININISNSDQIFDAISEILNKGKIKSCKIGVNHLIENICTENGAAALLANSILTRSKEKDGFKKLVSEPLKSINKLNDSTELDSLIKLESNMRNYIEGKERGKDGKDAREIDCLKLLCALLVLLTIELVKEKKSLSFRNYMVLNDDG